jgi:hypothetical protein
VHFRHNTLKLLTEELIAAPVFRDSSSHHPLLLLN